jgi:hypothetical protein
MEQVDSSTVKKIVSKNHCQHWGPLSWFGDQCVDDAAPFLIVSAGLHWSAPGAGSPDQSASSTVSTSPNDSTEAPDEGFAIFREALEKFDVPEDRSDLAPRKMSKQMLSFELMLGWYIRVVKLTLGGFDGNT